MPASDDSANSIFKLFEDPVLVDLLVVLTEDIFLDIYL
jgi:hypothetical protein